MLGLLSKILSMCGIVDYTNRVEFAAHVGWSIVFMLAGFLCPLWAGIAINSVWFLYTFYDEFFVDGYKGADTLVDLGSKLCGQIGYTIFAIS